MDMVMEIGFWGMQFALVSALLLGAYRLRPKLGLSAVVAVVVSLQFFQGVLGSSFYWEAGERFMVSPGSVILFSSNLALLLYSFARDGIATARVLLYAILIGNIVPYAVGALLWFHIQYSEPHNFLGIPEEIFYQGMLPAVVGISVLYIDQVLALLGFSWMRRRFPFLPVVIPLTVTLVVVLAVDTVLFLSVVHFGHESLSTMIVGGVLGKAAGGMAFGVVWGSHLQRQMLRKADDLKQILRFVFFRDDVEKLREAASRDGMTGLYNRRTFDRIFGELLRRDDRRFSLILCDVDHFKQVNDTLGHDVGDEVLIDIARHIEASTREMDFAFRIGGDEFAVVLPRCDAASAGEVAGRIKSFRFEDDALKFVVTLSTGKAEFPAEGTTQVELYRRADEKLYKDKESSRL